MKSHAKRKVTTRNGKGNFFAAGGALKNSAAASEMSPEAQENQNQSLGNF